MRVVVCAVAAAFFALAVPGLHAQAPNITTTVTEASAVMPGTFGTEVTSGSGYDSITGAVTKRVVDFEVPGSVGIYPLKMVRTYTSPSGWHMSFLWTARESFMGGGGYDWNKLDEFDDPMTKHTVWIGSPDGQSVSVDGNYGPVADQIRPGNTYDVERTSDLRITAIVIHFPDGG